ERDGVLQRREGNASPGCGTALASVVKAGGSLGHFVFSVHICPMLHPCLQVLALSLPKLGLSLVSFPLLGVGSVLRFLVACGYRLSGLADRDIRSALR